MGDTRVTQETPWPDQAVRLSEADASLTERPWLKGRACLSVAAQLALSPKVSKYLLTHEVSK